MYHRQSVSAVILSAAVATLFPLTLRAQTSSLVPLPGNLEPMASGISNDGSTVIGVRHVAAGALAVLWRLGPTITLVDLDNTRPNAFPLDVSADGGVIVGMFRNAQGVFRAFRCDPPGLIAELPGPVEWGHRKSDAVAPDGSFAVGTANLPSSRLAVRWNELLQGEELVGGEDAGAIGPDGEIYGINYTSIRDGHLVRWSKGQATTLHSFAPTVGTAVHAVSADGSTVVGGYSSGAFTGFAWRWSQTGGLEPLPLLPGLQNAQAEDVSGDGRFVVGTCSHLTPSMRAFIWSPGEGTLPLDTFLVSRGVDILGWTLQTATGISADGRTIVGSGTDAIGRNGAYVVTIPNCPADFNADGVVNSQDFFNFLDAFFLSEEAADFNDDGTINSSDFFDFLNAFFTGCA